MVFRGLQEGYYHTEERPIGLLQSRQDEFRSRWLSFLFFCLPLVVPPRIPTTSSKRKRSPRFFAV